MIERGKNCHYFDSRHDINDRKTCQPGPFKTVYKLCIQNILVVSNLHVKANRLLSIHPEAFPVFNESE